MLLQSSLSMNIEDELHLHHLEATIDKTPPYAQTNLAVPTGFALNERDDDLERVVYRSMN